MLPDLYCRGPVGKSAAGFPLVAEVRREVMGSVTRTALTILVAVSALGAQPALGSPLLLTFEGELSQVEGGSGLLDPSIIVGASFSGSFSYDPVVEVDLYPADPTHGAYSLSTTMTGKVGGVDYSTRPISVCFSASVTMKAWTPAMFSGLALRGMLTWMVCLLPGQSYTSSGALTHLAATPPLHSRIRRLPSVR